MSGGETTAVPLADDEALGLDLPTITDEVMRAGLAKTQTYTLMLLRKTSKYRRPEADAVVWEHGRRNFALREARLMPIVCPALDDSEWAGFGIFSVPPDRATEIMNEDPGVKAGIFTYELHAVGGFPGSALPG